MAEWQTQRIQKGHSRNTTAHASKEDQGVSDPATRTMVQEGGALVQPIGPSGPREALARALELAAEAGEWETVRALAEAIAKAGA